LAWVLFEAPRPGAMPPKGRRSRPGQQAARRDDAALPGGDGAPGEAQGASYIVIPYSTPLSLRLHESACQFYTFFSLWHSRTFKCVPRFFIRSASLPPMSWSFPPTGPRPFLLESLQIAVPAGVQGSRGVLMDITDRLLSGNLAPTPRPFPVQVCRRRLCSPPSQKPLRKTIESSNTRSGFHRQMW
jgi:hypothetical protein